MLLKKENKKQLKQLAYMALGDMNIYERKQLEFEAEQCLTYLTISTINVYKKL